PDRDAAGAARDPQPPGHGRGALRPQVDAQVPHQADQRTARGRLPGPGDVLQPPGGPADPPDGPGSTVTAPGATTRSGPAAPATPRWPAAGRTGSTGRPGRSRRRRGCGSAGT